MNALKNLIREVHRRSIWQVLSVYLVGSWGSYARERAAALGAAR